MIESPTTAPKPQPSREERYWAGFYGALMERYQEVAAVWAVPMMAVRIYAKRVGLDTMLQKLVLHGAPTIAERCRNELTVRQVFLSTMLTTHPPGDPKDIRRPLRRWPTISRPSTASRGP